MNHLNVPFVSEISTNEAELDEAYLIDHFATLSFQEIKQLNWLQYPYAPSVSFKIAYTDQAILLQYRVSEEHMRLNNFHSNSPVWEDSCVEFFISFQEGVYYNLEFNALGVSLIGYGTANKDSRIQLPVSVVNEIKSFSTIKKNIDGGGVHWCLGLYIPIRVFVYEPFTSLHGRSCRANFYKCGDLSPRAHYLSWSPISSPEPNFHAPDSFGHLHFVNKK